MLIYYGYTDNTYKNLIISGKDYPAGTRIRGSIDLSVNPESGTYGWEGPFHSLGTNAIQTITILDPIEVVYGQSLFYDLKKLTTIKGLENLYGGLIKADKMFANLPSLNKILDVDGNPAPFELKNLTTGACVSMTSMFEGFPLPGTLDVSGFDTRNIVNAEKMFKGAKASTINMQTCDTVTFRNTTEMFANCPNLSQILATEGHWDMTGVLESNGMFNGSTNLPNWPGGLDKTGAVTCLNDKGEIISGPGHISMLVAPQIVARTHINLRYDTLANWNLYDPVLMKGEVAIDSTTKRIKVGNGISPFTDLPYYDSYNPDHISTEQNSEGEMYVIVDNKTVFIGSEGLEAKQAEVDDVTVHFDADDKISLVLDPTTMEINANGELASLQCVHADGTTILDTNGIFSVPFDNDTIYVDSNGIIKAKGDIVPGKGIDFNGSTRELDVRIDDKTIVLQGDSTTHGYISVQYDGKSIFYNNDAGTQGALSGHYTEAGDGVDVKNSTTGNGTAQTVSVNIDNDTVKLVDNKLTVNIDNQSIKMDGGVLTAPGKVGDVKLNGTSIVVDGEADIPIASANQLGVVKIGNPAYGLSIAGGAQAGLVTIVPASDAEIEGRSNVNKPITPSTIDLAVKEGLVNNSIPLTDAEKEKLQEWLDIQQAVDGVTIIRNANKELTLPIDSETIQIRDGKLVATGEVVARNGLTATKDSNYITTLDVNVDSETVKLVDNKLSVNADNKYIISTAEGLTVPFDPTTFRLEDNVVKVNVETLAEFNAFWGGLL